MDAIQRYFHARPTPNTILDIGTGKGQFIPRLLAWFPQVRQILGIDPDASSLAQASTTFSDDPRIRFQQMTAERLALPPQSQTLVSLSRSLHHIADTAQAFSSIARVLAPEGYVLISDYIQDGQTEQQLSHVLSHHFRADIDRQLGKYHRDTYRSEEMRAHIEALGMEILVSEIGPKPPADEEAVLHNINRLQQYMQKAEALPQAQQFRERGEALIQRLQQNGFGPASSQMLLCRFL